MGIQGLLPFVRKVWQETDLSRFAGATVAVDIYCWLHKGAFACAEALALGKPTDQYVHYCIKLIKLLLRFRLKPILVFDGRNLPSKAATEEKRRQQRESNRRRAARSLADGRRSEAREYFERSIDVTPEMAQSVIKAARELGVDCLVAPYESDAQIAFLCQRNGIADLAISEDSDLLPFGCERVFFKLELGTGRGILIERQRLLAEGFPISGGISGDRFRHMCLLSGCDYYPGVNGVGLTTAAKVMSRTRLGDLPSLLSKLRMYLPRNDAAQLSPDEKESLLRAERTFLYQIVFDPINRRQVPLTPYPRNLSGEDVAYAGKAEKNNKRALLLALGNINIRTGEEWDSFDPDCLVSKSHNLVPHMLSIWDPRYRRRPVDERKYQEKKVESPMSSPQCQSGREKMMTVTYHPPKPSASPTGNKPPCPKQITSRKEIASSESTIFSQYFSNTTDKEETVKKLDDNDGITESDAENISFSSSVSPVFHRSHNRFAINSPTSSGEKAAKVLPRTRPRFSLDEGLSSISRADESLSNPSRSPNEKLNGSLETECASIADKDKLASISSVSNEINATEMSPTSLTCELKNKRPLSPLNDSNVMKQQTKRARISSPHSLSRSNSSILNWLSVQVNDMQTADSNSHAIKNQPKSSASEGHVKSKAGYSVSSKENKNSKHKAQSSSTKGVGMISQMMSLWKKHDKKKLAISQEPNDDNEVITIS